MHYYLDVYTHANRLRQIAPQQKLLFAIVLLLIALIVHPITQLFIAAWLTLWTIGYARIPAKVYWRVLFVSGLFLITSLPAFILNIASVSQIAAVQSDAIIGIPLGNLYLYCSRSGVLQAFQVAMRSIACTSCLLFVIFTVPFSDLLQVLRQWRVPVLLIELLLLMYRFVFLFLDALAELQLAQRARSGYRTRQTWMRSVGLLVSQLLVRSLHHYHQFTLALAARGFNGSFQIYTNSDYRYSKRYAIESILGCLMLLFIDRQF